MPITVRPSPPPVLAGEYSFPRRRTSGRCRRSFRWTTTATSSSREGTSTSEAHRNAPRDATRLWRHQERLRRLTGRFANASDAAFVDDDDDALGGGGRRAGPSSQRRPREGTFATSNVASSTSHAMPLEGPDAIVGHDDAADDEKDVGDACEAWSFVDYVKKMASSCVCSLAMFLDEDDDAIHEGRIIGVPAHTDGGRSGATNDDGDGIDYCRIYSDVSSLSDDTPTIYRKRYYAEDVNDGLRWYET
jgi:hypothetical protein